MLFSDSTNYNTIMFKRCILVLLGLHALIVWLSLYPWGHWQWALLAHFQVQYLGLSLCLTLWALTIRPRHVRHQSVAGVMGLLALAPSLWVTLPYLWPRPLTDATTQKTFTLLHANLFARNRQIEQVAQRIQQNQPEIVVLMEYTEALRQQLESQPVLKSYPHRWTGQSHVGVYSKYPVLDSQVTFVGLGAVANGAQLHTAIDLGPQRVHLVVAHPPTPIGERYFAAQQAHFAAWQQRFASPTEPVLIVGDLNTTPWSAHFRALTAHTPLQDSQVGHGVWGTWPLFFSPWGYQTQRSRLWGLLPLLQLPIDHVLHTPDIQILDWQRPRSLGSDHWPIWVQFRLS